MSRFRHWVNKPFSRAEAMAGSMWFVLTLLAGVIMIRAWHEELYRHIWAVGALWLAGTYITVVLFRELDRRPQQVAASTGRHRAEDRLEIGPKLTDEEVTVR